jgi:hypothetical protein
MRNTFGEYVRRRLEGQTPDEIHRRLVELNWTGFITTNYDTLIEDAYYDVHGRRLRLITWNDTDELGRLDELEAWIVKIHGCVTRTNTIVLDDSSLKQLLEAGTTAEVLRGLFRRYSIVFVGYGLGDPDVMPELRRLSAVFGSAARRHYALLSDSHEAPFWRHYLEQRYSVQPLIYSISGNHREGLAAWVDELRVQAHYEGRASRKKLLFLVKALRQRGSVPRDTVLVTDDIPRWGVLRAPEDEILGYPMEKAYLFPPVDDSGQDRIAAAAAFAENAGLPGEAVGVVELDEPFQSTKYNPALHRETEYAFRFVPVEVLGHEDWFTHEQIRFRDALCVWKSIEELREHETTQRLNSDVIDALTRKYGVDLERLPYSMSRSLVLARDPYANRARKYAELAWVQDVDILDQVFDRAWEPSFEIVLDLGCGPGYAGSFVQERLGARYVGVDRSEGMLREARARLSGHEGVTLLREDFMASQLGDEDLYKNQLFLLKNVLHLVPDIYELWSTLRDRWGEPNRLVVVETVSPSPECKLWVGHLFRDLGVTYKQHLFGVGELAGTLEATGLEIQGEWQIEQTIDVNLWLDSFDVASEIKEVALRRIQRAPKAISDAMKIKFDNGSISMLRLQNILIARYGRVKAEDSAKQPSRALRP